MAFFGKEDGDLSTALVSAPAADIPEVMVPICGTCGGSVDIAGACTDRHCRALQAEARS